MKLKTKTSTTKQPKWQSLPGAKFLREVESELRKVTWPNKDQVIRLTTIVIIISAVIGVYLGVLDFMFTNLMSFLIDVTN